MSRQEKIKKLKNKLTKDKFSEPKVIIDLFISLAQTEDLEDLFVKFDIEKSKFNKQSPDYLSLSTYTQRRVIRYIDKKVKNGIFD